MQNMHGLLHTFHTKEELMTDLTVHTVYAPKNFTLQKEICSAVTPLSSIQLHWAEYLYVDVTEKIWFMSSLLQAVTEAFYFYWKSVFQIIITLLSYNLIGSLGL